jgi:RNA polymerase sigma factor (sigma-70 family)
VESVIGLFGEISTMQRIPRCGHTLSDRNHAYVIALTRDFSENETIGCDRTLITDARKSSGTQSMGFARSSAALKDLETLFAGGTVGALSDGDLLERFVARRDEAAFEALVKRHGPMVLHVCRGVLADPHDAQDAVQATFLVLSRRAGSIRKRASVASWLFGVAGRIAARARVAAARRRKHESGAAEEAARRESRSGPTWPESEQERHERDLAAALHEELSRLPEKYREPVVLCYLEGRTYQEVADHLRRPIGTVKVRLSRARGLLRGRLTRRGLGLPAGFAAIELGTESASAAVPAFLVRSVVETVTQFGAGRLATGAAVQPAVELAVGLLRSMTMTKILRTVSLVLAIGVITLGAGVLVRGMSSDTTQKTVTGDEQKPDAERLKRELLGTWESVLPAIDPKTMRCVKHITPTHWTWVLYDRDSKAALSTAGGTWTLKSDKYEEINEFSSEDMKHARGKAYAFSFKIEGDKWHVKAGPEIGIVVEEVWVRVK